MKSGLRCKTRTRRAVFKPRVLILTLGLFVLVSLAVAHFTFAGSFKPLPEEKLVNLTSLVSDEPVPNEIGSAQSLSDALKVGYQALEDWDVPAALKVDEQIKFMVMLDQDSRDTANLYHAKLEFTLGNYGDSRRYLDAISNEKRKSKRVASFYDRVVALEKVSVDFVEKESEHFIIRVTKGKDEILIDESLEVLEKAYTALTNDLKIIPPRKVLVEIYPAFDVLSAATGLSEEDVETSGTVAVCKYNRLMLTSPRVTLRGYTYKDTLCHELVHYLIYLKCGYNCPIWLHEGIAKYEEAAWRDAPRGYMAPSAEALLAGALKEDMLISFERMHPSFAKLDSPTEGQLAFAEVSTAVEYIVERGGFDLLLKLVDEMSVEDDFKVAMKNALGEPYLDFQKKWKAYLRDRNLRNIEGFDIIGLKLKNDDPFVSDDDDIEEEFEKKKDEPSNAVKFMRLGDLLRSRGMIGAASIEYKKALDENPNSVRLLNKLGKSLTISGNPDEAVEHLIKAINMYPEYVTTYVNLGEAYFHLKDYEKASVAFENSLDINPFNHHVLRRLNEIYKATGNEKASEVTTWKLKMLDVN